jgi:hypothetical protein
VEKNSNSTNRRLLSAEMGSIRGGNGPLEPGRRSRSVEEPRGITETYYKRNYYNVGS